MTYDLTSNMANKERLGDPILQAAWDGTESRQHLDQLTADWEAARAKRDQIDSYKRREMMGPETRIQRMRDAISGLRELIAQKEAEMAEIEARYDGAYEAAEDECMRIEKELFQERHRLRCIAELSMSVKGN